MAKKSNNPTKVIHLGEPLQVGDNEVSELTMRRSIVRDRLEAQRTAGTNAVSEEVEVRLFGLLCNVPYEDLLELPDGEYDKLVDAYLFLKGSRRQETSQKAESGN